MEDLRDYKLRGTPDCPIAVYATRKGRSDLPFLHWHPELEILTVANGTLHYRLEKETLILNPGDILILSPEQLHGYISSSPDVDYWRVIFPLEAIAMPPFHVFQKEFVEPLQKGLLVLPQFLDKGHPAYKAVMEHMLELTQAVMFSPNYKLNRYHATVGICTAIAPWCSHLDSSHATFVPGNTAVRSAIIFMHNKYQTPLDLQAIAKHVHLHPNYLCALFKEHTGRTVLQHLTHIRVDAALFLLQNSDLSIEQIAEKTGFRSKSLFFRRFREITGTTPKAFRRAASAPKAHQETS